MTKASFKFTKVPNVVKKLSSVTLKWYSKKSASGTFTEICQTQHTIFVIDEKPEKANLRRADMNLFEVIDWSCSWADGASGKESVIDAIWKEFNPVKSSHSTGFEYWKNWNHPVTKIQPHQTIDFAIKGMDDTNPLSKNAVSCAVFDNT